MTSETPDFDYLATKGDPELSIPYVPTEHNDSNIQFLADKELSQSIDFCIPDVSTVKIYTAIFDINSACSINDTQIPFLKYAVEIGETASFPSFDLACSTTEDNDEHFKTESVLFLMKVLYNEGSAEQSPIDFDTTFRGIIYSKDHNCAIAVFDSRSLPKTTSSLTWAIVDELVFERRVWNVPVDVAISDCFRKNPILWSLTSDTLNTSDFPFALYMIKETDNVFGTEVSPSSDKPTLFRNGDTIDTYKYGDMYGDMYIFSQKPLFDDGTGSDRKYARYAVFTQGAKYLLEDKYHHDYIEANRPTQLGGETNTEEPEENEDPIRTEDVIYFVEDTITKAPTQLWGVRETARFKKI